MIPLQVTSRGLLLRTEHRTQLLKRQLWPLPTRFGHSDARMRFSAERTWKRASISCQMSQALYGKNWSQKGQQLLSVFYWHFGSKLGGLNNKQSVRKGQSWWPYPRNQRWIGYRGAVSTCTIIYSGTLRSLFFNCPLLWSQSFDPKTPTFTSTQFPTTNLGGCLFISCCRSVSDPFSFLHKIHVRLVVNQDQKTNRAKTKWETLFG